MNSKAKIRVMQVIAWLLAAVSVVHCGFWTYTFMGQGSCLIYFGEIKAGIEANIAELCLVMAVVLQIIAALSIKPSAEQVSLIKARNMILLSLILFMVNEITNCTMMLLYVYAALNGNPDAIFYAKSLLLDVAVFGLAVLLLIILFTCGKAAGSWKATRKGIGLGALLGLVVCIIINLYSGIPMVKANKALQNIDAFKDFELQTFDGAVATEDDLDDKTTVLNIWETTCGPCKNELPALESVAKSLEGSNVQIWGLCYDVCATPEDGTASIEEAKSILDEGGVTYCNLIPDKATSDKLYSAINAFPTTIVLDEDGKVLEMFSGGMNEEEWTALVEKYKYHN